MKKVIVLLFASFILPTLKTMAQPAMREYTVGHVFYVSLPYYMERTAGINAASNFEFKCEDKDAYGFIIEDNKEEMSLMQTHFDSIKEYFDFFIRDFLAGEKNRRIAWPQFRKQGNINYCESEATYYDKDAKEDIYYFIGVAETKTSFYKILCYTSLANKDNLKKDFESILYSLSD
jgi:hypothetical protein